MTISTAAEAYLKALDLDYIVDSLCAESYPLPRWTKKDAQHCCRLYKNFLLLKIRYPDQILVPTREIDEFWHQHILYTREYSKDCEQIFGFYFHHAPATPDEDLDELQRNYETTKALYHKEFGNALVVSE